MGKRKCFFSDLLVHDDSQIYVFESGLFLFPYETSNLYVFVCVCLETAHVILENS